jgi:multiple sugar transport system ATP-binding protein/alpha-glucoside transport system ATP-binding protein
MELYEKPRNKFVAQFIGSPKMNFFNEEDLNVERLPIKKSIAAQTTFGIRPEHLKPVNFSEACLVGKLDLVEQLGEYALVHLTTENGVEFIAKMEKVPQIEINETIGFSVKEDAIHLFPNELA